MKYFGESYYQVAEELLSVKFIPSLACFLVNELTLQCINYDPGDQSVLLPNGDLELQTQRLTSSLSGCQATWSNKVMEINGQHQGEVVSPIPVLQKFKDTSKPPASFYSILPSFYCILKTPKVRRVTPVGRNETPKGCTWQNRLGYDLKSHHPCSFPPLWSFPIRSKFSMEGRFL